MVPNLLHDLHVIYKLDRKEEDKDTTLESKGEECQGNSDNFQPSEKVFPVLDQDLNYLPYEEDESELLENETDVESSPGSVNTLAVFSAALLLYGHIESLDSLGETKCYSIMKFKCLLSLTILLS